MRRLWGFAIFWLACVAAAPAASAPLEAYGRLPTIEAAALAPDGAHFAFIVTDGERRMVAVFDTKTRKLFSEVVAGNIKVISIQWAGPEHIIVTSVSTTLVEGLENWRRQWAVPVDFDIRTRKLRPLLANLDQSMNVAFGEAMIRTVAGKPRVFVDGVHFVENQGRDSLFEFDVDSGLARLVRDGGQHTEGWLVDANGQALGEEVYDSQGATKKWAVAVHDHGVWKTVKAGEADVEYPNILGLGRDGQSILIADSIEDKDGSVKQVFRELTPGATDWSEPFAVDEEHDALLDPSTGALVGVERLTGDQETYEFYDPMLQKYWNAIVKAYPGDRVRLQSFSDDRKVFLIYVDSPVDGPSYAIVDIARGASDWLGGPYDEASKDLAPQITVSFRAADGLPLTGYLTTPKGVEAQGLPLVVFPHGGPQSRDGPGFEWWAQAMASRGYAVLQINYRGSGGFGWNFVSAGFGQFGRKMQTDLSDGVRYLAAKGTIDPKRVCIVGGSYGGYAALAGATIDTGVYRCAVSVAGISDLRKMENWERGENGQAAQRYWLRYLGVKNLNDPKLAEISPIVHIDQVAIPVLLIHGADDTTVPFEQSQLMFDALQKAGKPVELVKLKHEEHQLEVGDTRLQMLEATMAFLQKNNPP